MKYPHLIISISDFKQQTDKLIASGNDIIKSVVTTEEELRSHIDIQRKWEEEVEELLSKSFAIERNAFLYEFQQVRGEPSFYVTQIGNQRPLSNRVTDINNTLLSKIEYLLHNLRIIELCDYIALGNSFDIESRKKYTTQQKLDLILEKLYHLNDDSFYPIEMLLEGNGIIIKNSSEVRELAVILENNDYIVTLGGLGADMSARITSGGSMYVEEKGVPHTENYDDISNDQKEIDNRVDEIIDKLTTLGLGQEILFEELQELKELYSKLSKKNWGQVLKGKLVDLALAKLIENDTIKFIYEKLTGHELKLLG